MSMRLPGKKELALLGSFCFFLSAIEYMIPKPLPFLRIGIANLPLMLALDIFPLPSFLILVCIKIIGQAIITGTLVSYIFIFSFLGTFLSALLMFLLRRLFKDRITFVGIGTAGALVSNLSQLAFAHIFIFGESTRYIAPPFLAAGLVTGIMLGLFCEVFSHKSIWFREQKISINRDDLKIETKDEPEIENPAPGINNIFGANSLFAASLLIIPSFVFNPGTELRVIQFFFFLLLALIFKKKINVFSMFVVIASIIVFNLFIAHGRVLFSFGFIKVTSGALRAGVHRAITLQGLFLISRVFIKEDLKIPGAFGKLLGASLYFFGRLMSRKIQIKRKNIIINIDNMMLELNNEPVELTASYKIKTKPAGYLILAVIVILSWLPWLSLII